MVEASSESDLPTVLVVSTPNTGDALDTILKALQLKQGATVDTAKATW